MRVLFVLGFPNPFPGAGWTRVGFFAEDWAKKGNIVEILGTFTYKSLHKKGVQKFNKVYIFNLVFNMNLNHSFVFILNSVFSFIVSAFFLLAKRSSVAVISVPAGDVGLGALMACKLLKVKHIIDYRDEWEDYLISLTNHKVEKFFYSVIKKFLGNLYAKSQLVVVVTPNFIDALKHRGVVNVSLVPNGADAKMFKPLISKKANDVFLIFYSGVVGCYYRLDVAVKALKRLVDNGLKNIRLVIAGGGEVRKILALAYELGVSENVDYKGSISEKAKLARLISEADVGIIPYDDNPLWKNSVPAKFYEYCACGIPVIATAHEESLIATFIRKYRVGMISPPMNEEKLAEVIRKLYKDESFKEFAGKRARALIEQKFDRNKIAAEFLNLVEMFT